MDIIKNGFNTVTLTITNFLKIDAKFVPINLAKNGSGKISQNFAKLNSLPKFREIRTYKFREISRNQ